MKDLAVRDIKISIKKNVKVFFKNMNLTSRKWKTEKRTRGDFPGGTEGKNPPANAGDTVSSSDLGRPHTPQNS